MTTVLDENVVYTALEGSDPHNNPDRSPWALFAHIQLTCDRTMLTSEILGQYYELAWSRSRIGRWGPPCQAWVDLLTRWLQMDKVRLVILDEMPVINPESGVKDDDQSVVRVAKGTKSILVSYDERLEAGAASNGVTLVPPTRAIPFIRPRQLP